MNIPKLLILLVLATLLLKLLMVEGHSIPRWAIERRGVSSCHKRQLTDDLSTSCLLLPEVTEGPYYWPDSIVRRNITEGQEGVPLILNLTVVDASTCEPLVDVAVDVWHCNALGVYSHYVAAGVGGLSSMSPTTDNSTFLRGVQLTDDSGQAVFETIFPGYYAGRDTHIHLKVHLNGSLALVNDTSELEHYLDSGVTNASIYYYEGGSVVHTGQLFFEDAVSDAIDALAPYNENPGNRTLLDEDNVYTGVTNASYGLLTVAYLNASQGYAGGLVATIILGVDTSGEAAISGGGGQPGGGTDVPGGGPGELPPSGVPGQTGPTAGSGGAPGGTTVVATSSPSASP